MPFQVFLFSLTKLCFVVIEKSLSPLTLKVGEVEGVALVVLQCHLFSRRVFQLCLSAALLSQHYIRSPSPHVHLMNVHQRSTRTFLFREQRQSQQFCFVLPLTVQFLITVYRPGFRYQSTVFLSIEFARSYTFEENVHLSFNSQLMITCLSFTEVCSVSLQIVLYLTKPQITVYGPQPTPM